MNYLITYTGKRVDLPEPKPGQIDIVDIATHLSRIPRFIGATKRFFSVAQHSDVVAYLSVSIANHWAPPPHLQYTVLQESIREGKMHDAHEMITGDPPSPCKRLFGDAYKQFEKSIDDAIRRDFHLEPTMPEHVKIADQMALLLESHHLRGPGQISKDAVPQYTRDLIVQLQSCHWFKLAMETIEQDWDCETAKDKFLKEWWRVNE